MPEQTPDPEWLSAMFGMEPKDAVAFLKSKGLAVSWNWQEMLDEAHARAFTVAKATQLDVLRDIRKDLLSALKEGKTFDQFKKELEPKLVQHGWWGKQKMEGPDGEEQTVQLGSPRRLKTIYQTNLQSAYMAGRYKTDMEDDTCKYLRYVAVLDGRTRPAHRALSGRVYRKDDPIWNSIYPPNGFGCRCRVDGLDDMDMENGGYQVEESEDDVVTRNIDAGAGSLSGKTFPTKQTGVRVTLADGTPDIMWTDPGFNSSPMASSILDKWLGRKAVEAFENGRDAFKFMQGVIGSETRMKAWRSFLDNTERYGQLQGKSMTVGTLPFHVVQETGFDPVLYVDDHLFKGGKAIRHQASGDALSLQDWKDFPAKLQNAEWFRDTRSGNAVAVLEGGKLSAVFSPMGKADTVYRDAHIEQKIREELWVRLAGK